MFLLPNRTEKALLTLERRTFSGLAHSSAPASDRVSQIQNLESRHSSLRLANTDTFARDQPELLPATLGPPLANSSGGLPRHRSSLEAPSNSGRASFLSKRLTKMMLDQNWKGPRV